MAEDLIPVDGVSGVYPAVDVHDAAAHAVRHAVYGVADKLAGGHLSKHSASYKYSEFGIMICVLQ